MKTRMLSGLAALCLFIALAVTAARLLALTPYFYTLADAVFGSHQHIGVTAENYNEIVSRLITCMKTGNVSVLQFSLSQGGQTAEVFTALEISHMGDVANLFSVLNTLRLTASVTGGLSLFFVVLFKGKDYPFAACKTFLKTFLWCLLPVGLIGVLAAIDFDTMFELFHILVFPNTNWLIPQGSLLIEIMPLPFFILACGLLVLLFAFFSALCLLPLARAVRKIKHKT